MNKRFAVSLAALGLVAVVAAGCGSGGAKGAAVAAPIGDAVKGKEVYTGTCISCHGADGKGLPNLGKDLVVKSEWMKKQDDAALVAFVQKGRTAADPENTTKVDMPPKGGNPALSEDDIKNVVSYIRSIQK